MDTHRRDARRSVHGRLADEQDDRTRAYSSRSRATPSRSPAASSGPPRRTPAGTRIAAVSSTVGFVGHHRVRREGRLPLCRCGVRGREVDRLERAARACRRTLGRRRLGRAFRWRLRRLSAPRTSSDCRRSTSIAPTSPTTGQSTAFSYGVQRGPDRLRHRPAGARRGCDDPSHNGNTTNWTYPTGRNFEGFPTASTSLPIWNYVVPGPYYTDYG